MSPRKRHLKHGVWFYRNGGRGRSGVFTGLKFREKGEKSRLRGGKIWGGRAKGARDGSGQMCRVAVVRNWQIGGEQKLPSCLWFGERETKMSRGNRARRS